VTRRTVDVENREDEIERREPGLSPLPRAVGHLLSLRGGEVEATPGRSLEAGLLLEDGDRRPSPLVILLGAAKHPVAGTGRKTRMIKSDEADARDEETWISIWDESHRNLWL
jgi:hypothetical protein